MFLVNEILDFGIGRRQEALDRLEWIHGMMATHDGFVRGVIAKYLGDGTRHTILRVWRDEAAYRAFRAAPDGSYGKGRPEGLYVNQRVTALWNSLEDADNIASGPFLVKTQWGVADDAVDEYNESNEAVEALALSLGMVGVNEFKALEVNERLAITRFQDRAAYEALLEHPEYATLRNEMPESVERRSVACFEVVSEILPK